MKILKAIYNNGLLRGLICFLLTIHFIAGSAVFARRFEPAIGWVFLIGSLPLAFLIAYVGSRMIVGLKPLSVFPLLGSLLCAYVGFQSMIGGLVLFTKFIAWVAEHNSPATIFLPLIYTWVLLISSLIPVFIGSFMLCRALYGKSVAPKAEAAK